MGTLTEPFAVASAGAQGDGTSVFKVSAGQTDMGGVVAGASAITFAVDSTAEAVTGGGGAVPATAAGYVKITVNGTEQKIPYFN